MENRNFSRNIICTFFATVFLLLIPWILKWPWTSGDFVIMGALIFGTGFVYALITKNTSDKKRRMIVGAVLLFVFLLIWAELAVGLFGSAIAGS